MPHIVLLHSADLTDKINALLPQLSQDLEDKGVERAGIKCYSVPMSGAANAGEIGASLVHVNLRVMDKAGRTNDLITNWLHSLTRIISQALPEQCILTAEANFLPDIYISATA